MMIDELTFRLDEYHLRFENIKQGNVLKQPVLVQPDGKLGIDIARKGRILIDYQNGKFELQPLR